MPDLSAETAYLFRHALVREAAYQLQLPVDRARLHALALELCEVLLADIAVDVAPELARHARIAWRTGKQDNVSYLQSREVHWSRVAMKQAKRRYEGENEAEFAAAVIESAIASSAERCEASYNRAGVLQRLGQWDQAEAEFSRLLELARQADDALHQGHAIYGLGYLDWLRGRIDDCDRRMDEWVEFTRAQGDDQLTSAMLALATMRFHRGEVGRAREMFEEWLPKFKQAADEQSLVRNTFNYAITLQETGKLEEAEAAYSEALRLARSIGQLEYEGSILGSYGSLLKLLGRPDEALSCTEEATRIAQQIGNIRGRCIQLTNVGTVLHNLGRVEEALECYLEATGVAKEMGDPSTRAAGLVNIGLACLDLGRLDEARIHMRESAERWARLKDVAWEAYVRCSLSRVLRCQGKYDEAADELAKCDELLEGTQSVTDIFQVRVEQGYVALAKGETGDAESKALFSCYEELGDAYKNSAGTDVEKFRASLQAAKKGEKLIHGSHPDTLPEALRKTIES